MTVIHPKFCLNGIQFSSKNELLLFAKKNLSDTFIFLDEWFDNKNYVIVHTSGSTGKPKPIKISKKHMINSALTTASYFELQDDEISALLCLSPNYIAGKMMLVRALVSGWQLDVVAPVSNPLVANKKYDFTAMVPLQVHHSLNDLHKVKTLIVGGGAVSRVLQEKLNGIKTKIYSTYGMTETVTHIAVKKLNNITGITNYFEVLPNIKIEKDNRNCLVIDAPNLSNTKIITNDIVKLIDDKHFCWKGRYDNIINSGGIKIMPEQVEIKLEKIIKQRFFISSKKDIILGQKIILIIEGSKIKNIDFSLLDKYEKPKSVFYLDKFTETKTGKINRNACLKLV